MEANMSEHRQEPGGVVTDIEPPHQDHARPHRHLLGHLIATIVLAAIAAIAAWLLLTSAPGESKAHPGRGVASTIIGWAEDFAWHPRVCAGGCAIP